ncbi:hypothetical protein [Phormidium tenue]|uniref:Uncharacterized protein n=1 Tax=Phormidium tenue NIES-30 TaxID=549789 RepID=A0A1U7J095_9CYAN|nr:hypothetical protein [Phormidium tenue]MBD2234299.1 hypothetical protein [Phormidium tenue FACHB-1052]OKH44950.1 hypothetical protein NIES30_20880 [Phormidium tenue NIES-30]
MATVTIAGFTFDETDLVTDGSIIDGASRTLFFGSGLQSPELLDNTVGSLVGGSNGQSIALGNLFNRSTIELTWDTGLGPVNQAGDDFVVFENGFARAPEDYAVAVRSSTTGEFTPFRYEFFDSYDETAVNGPADGTGLFATAFDLSDFGLAAGDAIDAIRIVSLLNTDTVDSADGQGVVNFNETHHTNLLGDLFDRPLSIGKSDPDITLVAGLNGGGVRSRLQLFDADNNLVGGFSSIQAAVDATADGYTLLAAAGTYNEDVTLDKSLTLIGANFGLAGNDAARGAESILEGSFTLADDDISILGFEFTNDTAAIRGGSDSSVNFNNITIAFNDFVGLSNNNQTFITNGFGTGGGIAGGANWSITDNSFEGITGNDASIMRIDNVDGLLIADNVAVHDDAAALGRRGIQIDNSQNVEVIGNVVDLGVTDFSDEAAAFTAARYNLQLSLDVDGSASSTANVTIADNTFSGAYDGIVTLDDRDLSAVDIVDNSFSQAFYGIRLAAAEGTPAQGTQSDIEISGNRFDAIAAAAVAFDHRQPTEAFADIVVENNTFSGEFAGVTHISGDQRSLAGTNTFEGSDGNDNLLGGTDDDTLFGFGGNDLLDGGAGNNTAVGGDGIDTFGLFDGAGLTTVLDFDPAVDKLTNATFFDVILAQGTGVEVRNTFVLNATSFDAMAKLLLTDAVDITAANFV